MQWPGFGDSLSERFPGLCTLFTALGKNHQEQTVRQYAKDNPALLVNGNEPLRFVINAKVCRSVITTNLANCSYIRGMRWLFLFLALAMGTVVSAQDFDDAVSPEAQAAAAMRSKRYREAENIYRSLLQRNPESMTNKHLLSHALLLQQRFRSRIVCCALLTSKTQPIRVHIGILGFRRSDRINMIGPMGFSAIHSEIRTKAFAGIQSECLVACGFGVASENAWTRDFGE